MPRFFRCPSLKDIRYPYLHHKRLFHGSHDVVRSFLHEFDFDFFASHELTVTPIHVWDVRLASEQPINLAMPEGSTTLLAVLQGSVHIDGAETIEAAEVGLFDRTGDHICIDNAQNVIVLLLYGEPIDEPIVGSGPFVMNNAEEIRQAIADYQSGKMGHLSSI